MGFSSMDELTYSITTNGQLDHFTFDKTGTAPVAAGVWHSCWTNVGLPAVGAAPAGTPGTTYTATAGGINFPNVSTATRHLLTFGGSASQSMVLCLYDRLVAVGGLALTSTGPVTVNSATLPRYTDGFNVEAWFELTTALTTTTPVIHLSNYTDTLGNSGNMGGQVSFHGSTDKISDMVQLPIAAGDAGITAVTSLNVDTASSTGAGNLVLLRPLAHIPVVANVWNEVDLVLQMASLEQIHDGHCLAFMFFASATAAPIIYGTIRTGWN